MLTGGLVATPVQAGKIDSLIFAFPVLLAMLDNAAPT